MSSIPKSLKLIALTLLIGLVVLAVYLGGIITITVPSGTKGSSTYSLEKAGSEEPNSHSTFSNKTTRVVIRGNYEVTVNNLAGSFFEPVKVGGFFKKTAINASLKPEKARIYVGDNPGSCMFITNKLYSYECSDNFKTIKTHVPATMDQPTFVQSIGSSTIDGAMEATLQTAQGVIAVVHPGDLEGPGAHVAYLLDNDLKPTKTVLLSGLDNTKDYSVKKAGSGWIFYDSSISSIYQFNEDLSKATKIELTNRGNSLTARSLSTYGDTVSVVYSNYDINKIGEKSGSQNINNQIVVLKGGHTNKYELNNKVISSASGCGNQLICTAGDHKASVYAIEDSKLNLKYEISKVDSIESLGNSILVLRTDGVLNLDPASGKAYFDYKLGNYLNCGLTVANNGYVLCVIDKNKRIALYINSAQANSDNIDKKIQQLSKMTEINNISVNGQFIFIAPDYGQPSYSSQMQGYDYNHSTVQSVNAKITSHINSLKVDTNKYKVIFSH
jgi:hypothetical protein